MGFDLGLISRNLPPSFIMAPPAMIRICGLDLGPINYDSLLVSIKALLVVI